MTGATEKPRWIAARTRPGDGAPSLSISVRAGSTNVALIRFLERYGQQPEGTRVDIRRPGSSRHDLAASYVRGAHVWERTDKTCTCPSDCGCRHEHKRTVCGCQQH